MFAISFEKKESRRTYSLRFVQLTILFNLEESGAKINQIFNKTKYFFNYLQNKIVRTNSWNR